MWLVFLTYLMHSPLIKPWNTTGLWKLSLCRYCKLNCFLLLCRIWYLVCRILEIFSLYTLLCLKCSLSQLRFQKWILSVGSTDCQFQRIRESQSQNHRRWWNHYLQIKSTVTLKQDFFSILKLCHDWLGYLEHSNVRNPQGHSWWVVFNIFHWIQNNYFRVYT